MPKKAVASEVRRSLLNVRTTEKMRKRLEAAAAASGRSLIQEVEYRIELAFWLEEMGEWERGVFSNPDNAKMGQAVKLAVAFASKFAGEGWKESALTRQMMRFAVKSAVEEAFKQLPADERDATPQGEDLAHLERSATALASLAVANAMDTRMSPEAIAAMGSAPKPSDNSGT